LMTIIVVFRTCALDLPSRFFFFFFQAEDGIRAFHVTGVQTCALPIWLGGHRALSFGYTCEVRLRSSHAPPARLSPRWRTGRRGRSEERRVGKEGRPRGAAGQSHESARLEHDRAEIQTRRTARRTTRQ